MVAAEIDVYGHPADVVYERNVPEGGTRTSRFRVYLLAVDDPARDADPARFAEVQWTGRPDGWMVAGFVHQMPDGTMAIRALTIMPDPDVETTEASISRGVFRRLRGSTLTDQLTLALREAPGTRMYTLDGVVTAPPSSWHTARSAVEVTNTNAKASQGRPPLPDAELVTVVEAFLADPGHGYAARVARTLGLPESTVKNRLSRARDAGWLAPTTPGKRGEAREGPRYTAWRQTHRPVGSGAEVVVVDELPAPLPR